MHGPCGHDHALMGSGGGPVGGGVQAMLAWSHATHHSGALEESVVAAAMTI
jgi:hypothetical protein